MVESAPPSRQRMACRPFPQRRGLRKNYLTRMEDAKLTPGRHILASTSCLKQRRESLSEAHVKFISVT